MSELVPSTNKSLTPLRSAAKSHTWSGEQAVEAVANDPYARQIIRGERARFLSKTVLEPGWFLLLSAGLPLVLGCLLGAMTGAFGWPLVVFVLAMSSVLAATTFTFSSQRLVVTDQALYVQGILRPIRILLADIEKVEEEGPGRVRLTYRVKNASRTLRLADAEGLAPALTTVRQLVR